MATVFHCKTYLATQVKKVTEIKRAKNLEDCGGKLTTLPPGMVVKITGQGFAKVTKYKVEKLRYSLCGLQINAAMPDNICVNKYDATFKSQIDELYTWLNKQMNEHLVESNCSYRNHYHHTSIS